MILETATLPIRAGWLLFFLLLPYADCSAAEPDPRRIEALAAERTWLRLLHADKTADGLSAVNSPEFFVTDPDATPLEELRATLALLTQSPVATSDTDPRCRFPARYYWLSYELDRPLWRDFGACTRLNEWARFKTLDSVTLIMISGYFGNPASSFGHSLMRLNNSDFDRDSPLLDLGINFGARVPPDESTVVYILKGLFGGYQAGFSDRTFFEHDRTYTRVEHRDRWEYDLKLDEYQRTLLTLHLWELATREFTYYFLKENCSFRLAELLELVTGQDIVADVQVWYAPVSLFHDLRGLKDAEGESLFAAPRYVPSSDRVLRSQLAMLNPAERQAFYDLSVGAAEPEVVLEPLSAAGRIRVYSVLLDYFEYRLAAAEPGELPDVRAAKNRILQARLALPPAQPQPTTALARTPPSARAAPSALDVGTGYIESRGSYLALGYAPFRYEPYGNNSLELSSLMVASLQLGIGQGSVFLDSLDFVRARKVNAVQLRLPGESGNSWEVGLGLRRSEAGGCLRCVEGFAEGSMGRWRRLNRSLTAGASLGVRLSSRGAAVESYPQVALAAAPSWRWQTEVGAAYVFALAGDQGSSLEFSLASRYSFSDKLEMTFQLIERDGTQGRVALSHRW